MLNSQTKQLPFIWDYDISADQFEAMISGKLRLGRLDQIWAATRLFEYGTYTQIRGMLGFSLLLEVWPLCRDRIKSKQRKEAFDFLVEWLPSHHPELLH